MTACKHKVSGSFSLPSRGPFHLSLTVLFAIGHQVVFSLGGWSLLLPAGFLVSCGTLVPARSFQLLLTRLLRSLAALSNAIQLGFKILYAGPQPQKACSLVWALPISLAATFGIDLSFFSSGYLDVSVPRVPSYTLWIHVYVPGRLPGGFPHSDIKGSMPACGSPLLFAACHVLLRRLVPWHPPCALVRLIFASNPETNYIFRSNFDFPMQLVF